MDTNAPKTPATLPFKTWQAMTPAQGAHEVHTRLSALSAEFRKAALAWLRPERELAAELAAVDASQPLHGLPYLLKDLFDLAGVPMLAGSTFLDQVRPLPARDSEIATRLRERGASCAGKAQLVEFASGLTGENPHYGDCPHPQFPDRLSGGSSSGSAALVAAGVVPLSIGTDTGGSVRVPAAFCGLHGFRLTPREALIADAFSLAPTMDTAGWFTASAADMLAMWRAMVDGAPSQATPHGCYLPMSALLSSADPAIARACDEAAAGWGERADPRTETLLLESWEGSIDAYLTIGMSEANAVHRDWLAPYRDHYDPVIWQRFHDAGNYPPEKVASARAKQKEIWTAWRQFFLNYDYLILPAAPCPAPRKVDCTVELRRSIIRLTAPASLGGLPVLSIPVPLPSGLTGGLQIIVPVANSAVIPWILNP
jgi:Asp-tRNA(Asn)/Glu-tRNA(Gln) amidotransferase A subunit family amidase